MLLSGCSTTQIITKETPVLVPDSMLVSPCDITASGETVRTLATAKVSDANCIKKHKQVLDSLRVWKQKQQELYKDKNK